MMASAPKYSAFFIPKAILSVLSLPIQVHLLRDISLNPDPNHPLQQISHQARHINKLQQIDLSNDILITLDKFVTTLTHKNRINLYLYFSLNLSNLFQFPHLYDLFVIPGNFSQPLFRIHA